LPETCPDLSAGCAPYAVEILAWGQGEPVRRTTVDMNEAVTVQLCA